MSISTAEHRQASPAQINCAVLTVSDTRTLETDQGGTLLCELLRAAGHTIQAREILRDDPAPMRAQIQRWVADDSIQAILVTGGTGITARDHTVETISALLTKPLPGYGELFRMLSYEQVGAAAMLSRAIGGIIDRTVLLTMPGSVAAVRLAVEKLIGPELGHLVREANR
jgi:molybdenum cofactor biosynthesis protein B